MIPLNYHHLFYFYTIAKTGSVSLAARELRLAQSTLSMQLKQFESFLDRKLFEREKRKLSLTDEGREILGYANLIFDLGKELMDRQEDLSQKGRLRVQVGFDIFLPKTMTCLLISFLLKAMPETFVVTREDRLQNLLTPLKNHELDFILSNQLPEGEVNSALTNYLLSEIPVYFCAHPKFRDLQKGFPKSLHKKPVILPTASSNLAESIRSYFVARKIEPYIVGEVQDVEVVRRLVLEGLGVAPLNILTIKRAPSSQKLIVIGNKNIQEKIFLISKRRKNPHPLVEKIISGFKLVV